MSRETWDKWLRACAKNPGSPIRLPGSLGMLTGQDSRALNAIDAAWELYSNADADGQRAALGSVRLLLLAMQPKCRDFARELIARHLDWSDRERVWAALGEAFG